jgi:hypothetical protein
MIVSTLLLYFCESSSLILYSTTSPFGKRCSSIHDPRITGTTTSWLPHTETQGNSISTDINVDGLHQKRTHAILYGTPFGDQFNLDLDDWADLYKLVCNTPGGGGKLMRRRNTNAISELHKLQIALQMRGDAGWMYKYRPQHVVYKTLCMVVQKRAFRLEKSGMAHPIPIAKFNPGSPHHILVRLVSRLLYKYYLSHIHFSNFHTCLSFHFQGTCLWS